MSRSFGDYLCHVRIDIVKTTREKFCEGICTSKQLERLEKNECEPSIYTLRMLSSKHNIDFLDYFRILTMYQNEIISKATQKLTKVTTSNQGYETLFETITELSELKESEKELYSSLIGFTKVLYIKHCENNLDKATEVAEAYINKELPSFLSSDETPVVPSDYAMSLMVFLIDSYRRNNNIEKALMLLNKTKTIIERSYLSDKIKSFSSEGKVSKIYQAILYQLTCIMIKKNDYDSALSAVDKALSFSIENNMSRLLPELFAKKSEILKSTGDIKNSEKYRYLAKGLFTEYGLDNIAKMI